MTQPGTSPRWGWATPTSEWSPARGCDGADHQVIMLSAQAANAARVPKFFTVSSFLVFWFSGFLVLDLTVRDVSPADRAPRAPGWPASCRASFVSCSLLV